MHKGAQFSVLILPTIPFEINFEWNVQTSIIRQHSTENIKKLLSRTESFDC